MMKGHICSTCILPDSFPGISFSASGKCSYCQESEIKKGTNIKSLEERFLSIIDKIKRENESDYDCVLCFSGGKDSSYTLNILKEKYGLRILTYTFDNGFLSDYAKLNIKNVTRVLGVDNIIFSPDNNLLRDLFRNSLVPNNIYPLAALMRASATCTTCINFIKFHALKVAREKKIPVIIYGWAPGQIEEKSIIIKLPLRFLYESQKIYTRPFKKYFKNNSCQYFLSEDDYNNTSRPSPFFINPLLFNAYDLKTIDVVLERIGWSRPDDTDPNSTNCLLNSLANEIHQHHFGYNPYVHEISCQVRAGIINRADALQKFQIKNNPETIDYCLEKLGLTKEEVFNNRNADTRAAC